MKKIFRKITTVITVCMLTVLSSCEKDLYDDAIYKSNQVAVKSVSLNDLSKTENSKLFEKTNQFRTKNSNLLNKIVYDSINNFYFDDENGKVIEKEDGYKSYTFPISRPNSDDKIENILFSKNEIGEYDAYTVKYSFTEEQLKTLTQSELNQQTVTYTGISANKQSIICIDFLQWQAYPIDQGELTGNFGYGGHWVVISTKCENVADNTGGGSNGGGTGSTGWGGGGFQGGGSGSGSGSSGGGGGGGSMATTPVVTPGMTFINSLGVVKEDVLGLPQSVQQIIFNYLNAHNFDAATKANVKYALQHLNYMWLNEQPEATQASIFNYLVQNNFSSPSRNFVNQMIAAATNGVDVDFSKNIIYGITKPCQKGVVKDLMNSCSPFINTINQTFTISNHANIVFSNGAVPGANAFTNANYAGTPNNHTISIKFDDAYLDAATNLSIAVSTLHELVHAYLMSLYLSGQLVVTNPDYNSLLNAFMAFYDNQVQDTFDPLDNEIHNAMKDFIAKMSNSLYNYSQSQNINVTPAYCEQLAWGTMNGTNLFQTVLTPQQQADNETAVAIEQDHLAGAQGTPCP